MSTDKQTEANRENAQSSTGPKTPEGKAASSTNATTHGFNANNPVLPSEDLSHFDQVLARFRGDFKPRDVNQEFMIFEMVAALWKLNRLERMEAELLASLDNTLKIFTDESTSKIFDRLERYRSRLERTYHRSARALRHSQNLQNEAKSIKRGQNIGESMLDREFETYPDDDLPERLAEFNRQHPNREDDKTDS